MLLEDIIKFKLKITKQNLSTNIKKDTSKNPENFFNVNKKENTTLEFKI